MTAPLASRPDADKKLGAPLIKLYRSTSGEAHCDVGSTLTSKRLALVPMMKPASSKPVTQAVLFGGRPLMRGVPAYDRFDIADNAGSQDPHSYGEIYGNKINQHEGYVL